MTSPGRLAFPILCILGTAMSPEPARAAPRWLRVTDDGWFHGWRAQLQELVDQVPDAPPSRLCIVEARYGASESPQAYVIWPAQRRLITWFPTRDDPHALVDEIHVLHLDRDVVPTWKDINGSTYLVDRAWVRGIEKRCRIAGTTLTLAPRRNATRGHG